MSVALGTNHARGRKVILQLPISLHPDASSSASSFFSASFSQWRSAECAYEHAGVACVTRAVDTIPVDIPANSASDRMEIALRSSVSVAQ